MPPPELLKIIADLTDEAEACTNLRDAELLLLIRDRVADSLPIEPDLQAAWLKYKARVQADAWKHDN